MKAEGGAILSTQRTFFKNTASNLHPPALIFLFPAKLRLGNVPETSNACRMGFNASSVSTSPPSSLRSTSPHSEVSTSASASAACRLSGMSRVFGEDDWD